MIGRKESATRKATQTTTCMKEGDFILADVPKYAGEWPQVGTIKQVQESGKVMVHWFKGSKTTSWTPCTIPVPRQRGKKMEWLEEVDLKNIWHYGFSLTPSGHLPKKVKDLIDNYDH